MKNSILALSLLAISLFPSCTCSCSVSNDNRKDDEAMAETIFAFDGVKEVIRQAREEGDTLYILNRHTDAMWSNEGINNIAESRARTQSGIRLRFKTDSKIIAPKFEIRDGAFQRAVNNYYGVYRDGCFVRDYAGSDFVIESDGEVHDWMIALPIMYGVNFAGITIDDGARFYPVPVVPTSMGPIYMAIGDSITHGAGLKGCSSVLSYPYVLAETNGYYLYNTAVGGSQTSPGLVLDYTDIQADYVTVMWGYNDWNATKGDLAVIRERYKGVLSSLLETQKKARIYCILPTVSANEEGTDTYASNLQGVRDAEREVALSMNSSRIIIIDGKSLSSVDQLNGTVHFNNEGSVAFGKALAKYVK